MALNRVSVGKALVKEDDIVGIKSIISLFLALCCEGTAVVLVIYLPFFRNESIP